MNRPNKLYCPYCKIRMIGINNTDNLTIEKSSSYNKTSDVEIDVRCPSCKKNYIIHSKQ
jgi:ribosomal protein L34E